MIHPVQKNRSIKRDYQSIHYPHSVSQHKFSDNLSLIMMEYKINVTIISHISDISEDTAIEN